ncbi:MAG TPA: 2-oxoglutarate and iron-dependent oxygenase domain-containing protein [Stellaceae bacterium]|nr:2-oxoglutarate and iron-dependent oxygenase domain-containing protein [Stellaceae bacterium]
MDGAFPVIDIAAFSRPGASAAERAAIARRIGDACETIGFFAVIGHGISRGVVDALTAASYEFFALPLDEKLAVRRPRPEQNRGYIPAGDERLARLRGNETPADLKEMFAIGPFDLPDDPYFTGPAAYPSFAANLWPARPPSLRPALQAYWHGVDGLARQLCQAFALALDLPDDFFADKTDRHISQLRLMHYPPPDRAPLPGQLRAGEHSDLGMMTLIYSDNDVGGLEVMDRTGSWVAAPPIEDAFTVNLGDLMMRWTNDRWRSTLHRVANPTEGDAWRSRRLSIGMFFIPNYDAEIAPLVGTGAARYAPTTTAAYRTERFARTAGGDVAY